MEGFPNKLNSFSNSIFLSNICTLSLAGFGVFIVFLGALKMQIPPAVTKLNFKALLLALKSIASLSCRISPDALLHTHQIHTTYHYGPYSAVSCAATSWGMFRVGVNHWCSCAQPSKKGGVARQGSLCSCKSSGPDVQREGGGGKTNISLLESSAEWASALKNINNTRWNTKNFRQGGGGRAEATLDSPPGWGSLFGRCKL